MAGGYQGVSTQGKSTSNITSITGTFSADIPIADTVIVAVLCNASCVVTDFSDTADNSWALDATITRGATWTLSVYRSLLAAALVGTVDTFTATFSATSGRSAYIAIHLAGTSSVVTLDKATTAAGATSPITLSLGQTSVAAETAVLVSVWGSTAATTFTPTNGFTNQAEQDVGVASAFRGVAVSTLELASQQAVTAGGGIATPISLGAALLTYRLTAKPPPPSPYLAAGHALLGETTVGHAPDPAVYTQMQADQVTIGRNFAVLGQFRGFPASGARLGLTVLSKFVAQGSIPMLHLNCNALAPESGGPGIPLDSSWDSTVSQLFTDILSLGADNTFLRYHYEFQMLIAPPGGHNISGLANSLAQQQANYIAFWRNAHALYLAARTAGTFTNNIQWVWAPNGGAYNPGGNAYAVPWYPGDDVVDIIAGDFYGNGTTVATFKPIDSYPGIDVGYAWATTNTRGAQPSSTPGVTDGTKPFMLSENGTVDASDDAIPGTSKAGYFRSIPAWFLAHPNAVAWMYNNATGDTADNHIATFPGVTDAAYSDAANGAVFGSGRAGGTINIEALWDQHYRADPTPFPVTGSTATINVEKLWNQRWRDAGKPFTLDGSSATINIEALWDQRNRDPSVPFPVYLA